ncbi:MAG: formyl-CoA transferase [Acidobacteria bacterium]|nr:formyl-CoA transferase [Acidobacteriota bacterium]|tara:strand:+ start:2159 stop:3343 length:1185 start_codon:yes stop_codon:yes gene_type:complete
MAAVLDGVRVLDFGRYIAGPFCAALLADLGADVIRVEKVRGSEDRFVVPVASGGDGALFLQVNRNKRGLTLNPMKPDGQEVVRRLVLTADVVVANLPDTALEAMRLDYASLVTAKPDIILTALSAFGSGGSYSEKLGFDGIGQAMSGAMYLSGRSTEPTKSYVPWVDFTTALSATVGTLAALMARRQTGRGQQVRGSLLASALSVANSTLIEQQVASRNRVATLNRSQISAPSDTHRTQDGWVLVQSLGQPLFERWTKLMGESHWLDDPRFTDDMARGDNGEVISERMSRWCAGRTTAEALAELEEARIPAGPVYSPQQTLEDPHVVATGFLRELGFPGLPSDAPVADAPFSLSDSEVGIRHRAPVLGEHTDEILREVGYTAAEISALRDARVV